MNEFQICYLLLPLTTQKYSLGLYREYSISIDYNENLFFMNYSPLRSPFSKNCKFSFETGRVPLMTFSAGLSDHLFFGILIINDPLEFRLSQTKVVGLPV